MIFLDTIFTNLAYIMLPVSLYFLYILYKRTFYEKESNLILIIIIYSLLYIIYRYGSSLSDVVPLIIINVPLIIAMLKKFNVHTLIISFILVIYYYSYFDNFLIFIILEYLLYYLIYLKNKNNISLNLLLFSIIKISMLFLYLIYFNFSIIFILQVILEVAIFYLISLFIIIIFNKSDELFKIFLSVKELKQNKQIKSSLFKISHEIKNPIAVCKGYLDMFDINNVNHAKKYIPIIKEEINRTLCLLEDFSSMNKQKIKKEILDINLLLEEILSNYKLIFNKNNIKLNINISDEELYINGDYNRLSQVVINILKNSIEAKDEKKKMHMDVYTKIKDKYIWIYFIDNGVGISPQNLKKIKEPFFTTKSNGTGLGTALSDEIIKAHNGTILFDSIEGEKTTVKIKLPLENF